MYKEVIKINVSGENVKYFKKILGLIGVNCEYIVFFSSYRWNNWKDLGWGILVYVICLIEVLMLFN